MGEACDVSSDDAPGGAKSEPAPGPKLAAKRGRQWEPLPYGWIRKKSKTKGAYYYANILTGKTQVEKPGASKAAQGARDAVRARDAGRHARDARHAGREPAASKREDYEAAEAELEEAKRQAAERRAARRALSPESPESPESDGGDSGAECAVTGEELEKWKAAEQLREWRQAQREQVPDELPPVPRVIAPCLDILKDGKWVERHTLSGNKQRWTLGRAAGEVDFVMNHPSISRQHAALTRGGVGMYLMDLDSGHGIYLNGQRMEKSLRVHLTHGAAIKFGNSTRLYYFHEPSP
ncbi:unnamed protein product [Effrenium voratum]|uniref:FHA domain-containing protein n=1 Tax=Effrenium voratum TaxID=2562239 RepID=A0AA36I834_9DINO|nr:unnamed protein product [Effrenium voratum]